jgi:hypothetical protein
MDEGANQPLRSSSPGKSESCTGRVFIPAERGCSWLYVDRLAISLILRSHCCTGMFSVGAVERAFGAAIPNVHNFPKRQRHLHGMGSTIFFYLSRRGRYIPVVLSGLVSSLPCWWLQPALRSSSSLSTRAPWTSPLSRRDSRK